MSAVQRRAALLSFVLLVASLTPLALRVADAAGGRGAGLTQPYTFTTCDKTTPTDPVNVIWYQTSATPGNVNYQLYHMGWKHNDANSVVNLVTNVVDHQYVKEVNGCLVDDRQAATGGPLSSRYHVRLFSTVNARNSVYVAGDAHHDKVVLGHGCKRAFGAAGHIADSFDVPRERIVKHWPDPDVVYRRWGNTRAMRQCNGSFTRSDGWVAYLKTNLAQAAGRTYHPESTARPTISGTPAEGQELTAEPGAWSDPDATSFRYQWCKADLQADTCVNIDGATSKTWTPPAGSTGDSISVKVRPAGADAASAVLAVPVTITAPSGNPPKLTVGTEWPQWPPITVDPNGLDTTVSWFAPCDAPDADGHPAASCPSGSTSIDAAAGPTVLYGFGPEGSCSWVDYWVKAENADGTVWSNEISFSAFCS